MGRPARSSRSSPSPPRRTRRVVIIVDGEHIQTATPGNRKLRTIARVPVAPYDLQLAGTRIVVREQLTATTGRLVLLRPDGSRRAPRTDHDADRAAPAC